MKRPFTAGRVCEYNGCDRPVHARDLCVSHYTQWRYRGRDKANLTPLQPRGGNVVTEEDATFDVGEFEFLLSAGVSREQALQKIGICGRTMCRRYQQLGLPVPPGLWPLADKRKGEAA